MPKQLAESYINNGAVDENRENIWYITFIRTYMYDGWGKCRNNCSESIERGVSY